MKNNYDVWQTMYESDFSRDKYLYHYTNFSKAFLILDGQNLKFSKISLANDTLEAKPKINFEKRLDAITFSKIRDYFSSANNDYLQLLCFSQDAELNYEVCPTERMIYSDYSGRGFALPRMWAQYADNNNGVCFVFDKKKLINIIKESLWGCLIHYDKVHYITHYKPYEGDMNDIVNYIKKVSVKNNITSNIKHIDFLNNYKDFVKYNYFTKLDDWKSENEFRFLAYGDEDHYVPNIFEAIVGIVIGENTSDTNMRIIKFFCDEHFDIVKISFNCDGCILKNIYE